MSRTWWKRSGTSARCSPIVLRVESRSGAVLKRLVDVLGASAGLVVLFPFGVLLAALIKLDSPGPVIFRQLRVGRGGRPFRIWKFRTMQADAVALGPGITTAGDRRVTRVGRYLRRWKIDELPQLANVVRGEMSLVGPRPELPEFVELYDDGERAVLDLRPGITDPASLQYRNEEEVLRSAADPLAYYCDTVLRKKIELNLEYRARATVFSDIRLVLRTIAAMLR